MIARPFVEIRELFISLGRQFITALESKKSKASISSDMSRTEPVR